MADQGEQTLDGRHDGPGRFYLEHGHHQGCRCRDGSVTITADGVDILPSMPESPTLDADMIQPYLDGWSECGPR
ncbi:hypothetical protein AB0I91_41815 [Actinosynnema sp. NPDC049800]